MLEGQLDGGPVAASRLGGGHAEEIALDWNFGQSVSGLYDVSRLDIYRASFVSFLEDRCRAAGVSPLDDRSQARLCLSLSLSLSLCRSSCAVACFGVFDFGLVVSRGRLLSCSSASSSGSLFSAATLAISLRVSWPRWAARGVSSMSSVPFCLARSSLCVCFGVVDEDDRARREDIASRLRIRS